MVVVWDSLIVRCILRDQRVIELLSLVKNPGGPENNSRKEIYNFYERMFVF